MSHYVDGFLLPIAADRITEYQKVANTAGAIWKEHGAIAYWECVGMTWIFRTWSHSVLQQAVKKGKQLCLPGSFTLRVKSATGLMH